MIVSAGSNVPRLYRTLENGDMEVAILIADGWEGDAWSSFAGHKEISEILLFHKDLIATVELHGNGPHLEAEIRKVVSGITDNKIFFVPELYIQWIPRGMVFRVEHYGETGNGECVLPLHEEHYFAA